MKRNIIITIVLLTLTRATAQAGGHHHGYGGNQSFTYHFPKPAHYTYHPFNPRSW